MRKLIELPFDADNYHNGEAVTENNISPEYFFELNAQLSKKEPGEILQWGFRYFGKDMVIGTGFGPSGMLLIHKRVTQNIPVTIFYLDTSLLFTETYRLRDELEERFDIKITAVRGLSLDEQAEKYGDELWKSDPDKCCHLRKVLPLQRYLSDKKAWVTGVRRSQSGTRSQTNIIEWDPANRVVKINPLAKWTDEEVWNYIREHELPYNPLHDDGYPTIGCIPCTEPADPKEDVRSGRWQNLEKTECGIHIPSQNFQNGNSE
ncbi:MAG: phosphoadenylyl-sulfate reductase [Balneolaceae bacterium]